MREADCILHHRREGGWEPQKRVTLHFIWNDISIITKGIMDCLQSCIQLFWSFLDCPSPISSSFQCQPALQPPVPVSITICVVWFLHCWFKVKVSLFMTVSLKNKQTKPYKKKPKTNHKTLQEEMGKRDESKIFMKLPDVLYRHSRVWESLPYISTLLCLGKLKPKNQGCGILAIS